MNRRVLACLAGLLCCAWAVSAQAPAPAAATPAAATPAPAKISDLGQAELEALSRLAYMSYGSTMLTGRLIFRGLEADRFKPEMLLETANFYTEVSPPAAAVFYYWLYSRREGFGPEFQRYFMIMFSDAMNQYGLAKSKSEKRDLTLGDIVEYGDFEFDIEGLKAGVQAPIEQFGSIERCILIFENVLGRQVGLVAKNAAGDYSDYATATVRMTDEYRAWLASWPEGMDELRALAAGTGK